MKHQIEPLPDGRVACSVCGRTWKRHPRSECPGVLIYAWGQAPAHLKTVRQLKKAGLKLAEGQEPGGCVIGAGVYYLYDERQAAPRPPATPAQLAALARTRAARTCTGCEQYVRSKLDLVHGLCATCWHWEMIERARTRAIQWAREVLADERAIILDTETTGLGDDAEIVEIAAVDARGQTLLDTLVKPQGNIPAEASASHGLTDDGVAGDSPEGRGAAARRFQDRDLQRPL